MKGKALTCTFVKDKSKSIKKKSPYGVVGASEDLTGAVRCSKLKFMYYILCMIFLLEVLIISHGKFDTHSHMEVSKDIL